MKATFDTNTLSTAEVDWGKYSEQKLGSSPLQATSVLPLRISSLSSLVSSIDALRRLLGVEMRTAHVLVALAVLFCGALADHYRTLGVARTATQPQIKSAFQQLAKQWYVSSQ